MRRHQQVDAEPLWRQDGLDIGRDIAGQKDSGGPEFHPHNAAHRIAWPPPLVVIGCRVNDSQLEFSGLYRLPRLVAFDGGPPAQQSMPRRNRTEHSVHCDTAQDGRRATGMVQVKVGGDEAVASLNAAATQERKHDAFTGICIARIARPGVIQLGPVARLENDGRALADIERRHPQLAGCRPFAGPDQQG